MEKKVKIKNKAYTAVSIPYMEGLVVVDINKSGIDCVRTISVDGKKIEITLRLKWETVKCNLLEKEKQIKERLLKE